MFNHVKSVVAVGLAVLLLIGAELWVQNRTRALRSLKERSHELTMQVAEGEKYSAVISVLQTKIENARRETKTVTSRFATRGQEGAQLLQAVVDSASAAGMEICATAETALESKPSQMREGAVPANVVSYRFSLKGSYTGLVSFFQAAALWKLESKVESLQISVPEGENNSSGEITVDLVLSVFSIGA